MTNATAPAASWQSRPSSWPVSLGKCGAPNIEMAHDLGIDTLNRVQFRKPHPLAHISLPHAVPCASPEDVMHLHDLGTNNPIVALLEYDVTGRTFARTVPLSTGPAHTRRASVVVPVSVLAENLLRMPASRIHQSYQRHPGTISLAIQNRASRLQMRRFGIWCPL